MKLVARTIRDLRARRQRVAQELAKAYAMLPGHIDDHDLERYHLGMVKDPSELAALEEHLLSCGACVDRTEATAQYVDAVRAASLRLLLRTSSALDTLSIAMESSWHQPSKSRSSRHASCRPATPLSSTEIPTWFVKILWSAMRATNSKSAVVTSRISKTCVAVTELQEPVEGHVLGELPGLK